MKPSSTLERAFALAKSGRLNSFTEILSALKHEGYFDARAHLDGPSIRKQLSSLIAEGKTAA
ncbi:MAG: hypothetical protein IT548_05720 [Alphaproteobacteria bacterium]|nr:hypothetical protein [Alphaproteobacteria bacterium]